jgi:hypothetical protein
MSRRLLCGMEGCMVEVREGLPLEAPLVVVVVQLQQSQPALLAV